jgi:hypothetical protein
MSHAICSDLDKFLSAFFPDENEPIHLRAFKAKGAPDAPENRPCKWKVTRKELRNGRCVPELARCLNEVAILQVLQYYWDRRAVDDR